MGSRSEKSVKQALAVLPENATGHPVDVTDQASIAAFFDQLGTFDHLAYTAGDDLVRG